MHSNKLASDPEEAIRRAVATGAYAEAGLLLDGYCSRLETPDDASRARNLLNWMFRTVSAARAHDQATLRGLAATAQYFRRGQDRGGTWKIDA